MSGKQSETRGKKGVKILHCELFYSKRYTRHLRAGEISPVSQAGKLRIRAQVEPLTKRPDFTGLLNKAVQGRATDAAIEVLSVNLGPLGLGRVTGECVDAQDLCEQY